MDGPRRIYFDPSALIYTVVLWKRIIGYDLALHAIDVVNMKEAADLLREILFSEDAAPTEAHELL